MGSKCSEWAYGRNSHSSYSIGLHRCQGSRDLKQLIILRPQLWAERSKIMHDATDGLADSTLVQFKIPSLPPSVVSPHANNCAQGTLLETPQRPVSMEIVDKRTWHLKLVTTTLTKARSLGSTVSACHIPRLELQMCTVCLAFSVGAGNLNWLPCAVGILFTEPSPQTNYCFAWNFTSLLLIRNMYLWGLCQYRLGKAMRTKNKVIGNFWVLCPSLEHFFFFLSLPLLSLFLSNYNAIWSLLIWRDIKI